MSRTLIKTIKDLEKLVEEWGFLPFFRGRIPGFSVGEIADPSVWYDEGDFSVWDWKGPVIQDLKCAYGKFFEKKAAFISREWFFDFANYRRDGYDYEGMIEDELVSYKDRKLYELVAKNGPVLSKELKALGNYRKGGNTGFDTSITRLQMQGFVERRFNGAHESAAFFHNLISFFFRHLHVVGCPAGFIPHLCRDLIAFDIFRQIDIVFAEELLPERVKHHGVCRVLSHVLFFYQLLLAQTVVLLPRGRCVSVKLLIA